MTDENDQVLAVLQEAARRIEADHPELFQVMGQARKGEISEDEALGALMVLAGQNAAALDQTLLQVTAPLREGAGEAPNSMGVFDNGVGLPRMNPLVEAAILERIQFDGDIPELRTGPLPAGVEPAVPVLTTARDPAVIGGMLREASAQTLAQIQAHDAKRLGTLSSSNPEPLDEVALAMVLVDVEGGALTPVEQLVWGSAETDLPTYRRGEIPTAIQVPQGTGSALALLTPEQRREDAWKFLSTTAGRRSALPIVRSLVHTGLRDRGLQVEANTGPLDTHADVLSYREWTVVLAGPQSTQASAPLLDLASESIVRGLLVNLSLPDRQLDLILDVVEVNTVDVRRVGWGARLTRG